MNSLQIEYALALAEERSFSKAAKKLFISQPAFSQYIKNLETLLNVTLFDRSTTPIQLTSAGEIFISYAKKVKASEIELNQQLNDLSELQAGEFNIGTSPFRASCLLPKSIAAFNELYPGIKLNIITDTFSELKNALYTGKIDLCIDSCDFESQMFHSEYLDRETFYLAVPANHPFVQSHKENMLTKQDITKETEQLFLAKPINLSECEQYPFVFLDQMQSIYQISQQICKDGGLKPQIKFFANQIEIAFHWVLSGIAFSFIPDTLIRFGNYQEHPVYFKLNVASEQSISVAFKQNRYIPLAAKVYVSTLKQLIGQGTWLPTGQHQMP